MGKYPITAADVLPGVDQNCLRDMLWEAYYRGWESAGRNRECNPGKLLNDPQKRAYRAGYYDRCRIEGEIVGFLESLGETKERE